MKVFLKSNELSLENGGYLTNVKGLKKGEEGSPVSNKEFIEVQKHAEYVVTLAEAAKGKDFKGKKADSIEDLKAEVYKKLNETQAVEFVKAPKEIKRPTHDKLKEEALAFLDFEKEKDHSEKVNKFLQQFVLLHEFETHGLFFDSGIAKLNKIYTMKDVTKAVQSMIDHLD